MNQTVITEDQARQVTGGRKPLVPIEYERAVNALMECMSIDDAKYWSDKADALAAWAKIYRNDEACVAARRLKLHAYRRMGRLAEELRPVYDPKIKQTSAERVAASRSRRKLGIQPPKRGEKMKGPTSLLMEYGMSEKGAGKVLRVARAPQEEFDSAVDAGAGIDRATLQWRGLETKYGRAKISSDAWVWLTNARVLGPRLHVVRSACRTRRARDVAAAIDPGEVRAAKVLLTELSEWFDEFEQYLPNEKEAT